MSIQVSNITNLGQASFRSIELSGSGKPLPKANSIVAINVLEKLNDGYKVMINGRVFSSNLPVNAAANETLIAKVLSQSPFILSLDSFTLLKSIDESISFLLSKLQLPSTTTTERLLKAFILNKKPVMKSKLEKLVEIIESHQLEPDADQLDEIVAFFGSGESGYQSITASSLKLLMNNNTELSTSILNHVRELNKLAPDSELVSKLNQMLVLNLEDQESINPINIKDSLSCSKNNFEFICYAQENIPEGEAGIIVRNLIESMLIYNLRKVLTSEHEQSHQFIILKEKNNYELLEFNIEQLTESNNFNVNMNPVNLGKLNARGIFSENMLSMDLISEPDVNTFLNQTRGELEERLTAAVRCRHKIRMVPRSDDSGSFKTRNGRLNVRF